MDSNTIYTKTSRGSRALIKKLPKNAGMVLSAMDGEQSPDALLAKLPNISETDLELTMKWLLEGGFIKVSVKDPFSDTFWGLSNDEVGVVVNEVSAEELASEEAQIAEVQTTKDRLVQADIEARERAEAALKAQAEAGENDVEEQRPSEAISLMSLTPNPTPIEDEALMASLEEAAQAESEAKAKEEAKKAAFSRAAKEQVTKEAAEKQSAKERVKAEQALAKNKEAIPNLSKPTEQAGKQKVLARKRRGAGKLKRVFTGVLKSIKPLSIYAFSVLLLLVFAAQFINFHIWAQPIKEVIASKTQEDVSIESIHIALFPSPHLVLEGLNVTNSSTIRAEKLRFYPLLSNVKEMLFAKSHTPFETKTISIEGFSLAQKDLYRLKTWGAQLSNNTQLKVRGVSFKEATLNLNSMDLPKLKGELLFAESGAFEKATLSTDKDRLTFTVEQAKDRQLVSVSAKNWRSPIAPHPEFNQLKGVGSIANNQLTFTKITGVLYQGKLTGNLIVDLKSDKLASKGEFNLKGFSIPDMAERQQYAPYVIGRLNSHGSFSYMVNKATNRIENTSLNAAFDINNGMLKTVDLVEAMRSANLSGTTHFEKLAGLASIRNGVSRFTSLRLKDKQLRASGEVHIARDAQVSANVTTNIGLQNNNIQSKLKIGGPITTLSLSH